MVAKPKRKRYEKRSEDRIHQHPAQPLWLHWNRLLLWLLLRGALRAGRRHHGGTHSEKLARTARGVPAVQRLDGYVPVKERGAVASFVSLVHFLGSNYVLPLGNGQERAQSLPPLGNENCAGRGLDVTAGRGCVVGCLHRRRHGS